MYRTLLASHEGVEGAGRYLDLSSNAKSRDDSGTKAAALTQADFYCHNMLYLHN